MDDELANIAKLQQEFRESIDRLRQLIERTKARLVADRTILDPPSHDRSNKPNIVQRRH